MAADERVIDPEKGPPMKIVQGQSRPLYSASALPSDPETWRRWRKRTLTSATRMDGPFLVDTGGGGEPAYCADGWLAIDAHGNPYPITAEEFSRIYELGAPGRKPASEDQSPR